MENIINSKKMEIEISPGKVERELKTLVNLPDNLDRIRARELWQETDQGSGIVIAVVDSGIQEDHPSLSDNIIGGYNFTSDDNGDPDIYTDYLGHGTHVSGIIAANDNNKSVVGVAPKSRLLILKIIEQQGIGNLDNLIKAIQYAIEWRGENGERVHIINMSLGVRKTNNELYRVIKKAYSKGVVLVAAAGNEGDGIAETIEVSFPGFYKEVIQVGAVSNDLIPSVFSNTNVNLDFVGPGESILSTHLLNSYVELTGTSMAAPFVSGSVALVIKKINKSKQSLIPMYVYNYLLSRALPLKEFPINQVGNGFIQLK